MSFRKGRIPMGKDRWSCDFRCGFVGDFEQVVAHEKDYHEESEGSKRIKKEMGRQKLLAKLKKGFQSDDLAAVKIQSLMRGRQLRRTRQIASQATKAFKALDTNNNGSLQFAELQTFLRGESYYTFLRQIDTIHSDGNVQLDEWLTYFKVIPFGTAAGILAQLDETIETNLLLNKSTEQKCKTLKRAFYHMPPTPFNAVPVPQYDETGGPESQAGVFRPFTYAPCSRPDRYLPTEERDLIRHQAQKEVLRLATEKGCKHVICVSKLVYTISYNVSYVILTLSCGTTGI
jgi:hypothetical protein